MERLCAATERYRMPVLLAAALPAGRDVQAGALAEAALDRDADRAAALLRDHYLRTVSDLAEATRLDHANAVLPKPVRRGRP